jgi:hypothetical protein
MVEWKSMVSQSLAIYATTEITLQTRFLALIIHGLDDLALYSAEDNRTYKPGINPLAKWLLPLPCF